MVSFSDTVNTEHTPTLGDEPVNDVNSPVVNVRPNVNKCTERVSDALDEDEQSTTKPKQQTYASHTEPFDEAAFKKSFLIPKLDVSKKKKKVYKMERQSTVITSEAWKEMEKKKLEEKERLEAEKVARKIEREQKRVMDAQVKAEKKAARENKKIEKAALLAEKKSKLSRVSKKKIS